MDMTTSSRMCSAASGWHSHTMLLWISTLLLLASGAKAELRPQDLSALRALLEATDNPMVLDWDPSTDPCEQGFSWINCPLLNDGSRQRYLRRLTLRDLDFGGTLSPAISNMTKLESLTITNCNITGEIPLEIGTMSDLQRLQLDNNLLTSIPAGMFSGLVSLQTLSLANNPFEDFIAPPEIGSLSLLVSLELSGTSMEGGLPESYGQLTSITYIGMRRNSLTGTIPATWGTSLSSLQVLKLNNNQLTGPIPESLTTIPVLSELELQNNLLSGTIPQSIGDLTFLKHLMLSSNNLVGGIPESLGQLNLETFSVGANSLTGPLPEFMSTFPASSYTNNGFCSSIPGADCTAEVTALLAFLEGVGYPGLLASWQGGAPCTSWAVVSCNSAGSVQSLVIVGSVDKQLSGTISPALAELRGLVVLNLAGNNLTGSIPNELASLPSLRNINLSNNELTGTAPVFDSSVNVNLEGNSLASPALPPAAVPTPAPSAIPPSLPPAPAPAPAPLSSPPLPAPSLSPPTSPPSEPPTAPPVTSPLPPPAPLIPSPSPPSTTPAPSPSSAGIPPSLAPIPSSPPLGSPPPPLKVGNPPPPPVAAPAPTGRPLPPPPTPSTTSPGPAPSPTSPNSPFAPAPGVPPPLAPSPAVSSPTPAEGGTSPPNAVLSPPGTSAPPGSVTPPPPSSGLGSTGSGGSSFPVAVVVGSLVGIMVLAACMAFCCFFLYRRKRKTISLRVASPTSGAGPGSTNHSIASATVPFSSRSGSMDVKIRIDPRNSGASNLSDSSLSGTREDMVIKIEVIQAATNDFDEKNIVGRGGFGTVYQGVLGDGTMVAVKRMEVGAMSNKGRSEFEAEIGVLTKVRHRHLVGLLGYVIDGFERLLVYEYLAKGPLSRHLFDHQRFNLKPMDWKTRVSVALDVARGMEYLHSLAHKSFIHRDLKPSNILLDDSYRAKVSDFGLVKHTDGLHSIETRLAGTFGYLAPEYAVTGRITTKSDVYSFGVVLMELITGRRALDESRAEEDVHLVTWFPSHKDHDRLREVLDKALELEEEEEWEAICMVAELAGHCTARDPKQRPPMSNAVAALTPLVQEWKPQDPLEDTTGGIDMAITLTEALEQWKRMGEGDDLPGAYLPEAMSDSPKKPLLPALNDFHESTTLTSLTMPTFADTSLQGR